MFYPFRSDDNIKNFNKMKKKSQHHLQPHGGFLTCLDISRDGQLSVTGALDHIVNVWQLNSQELVLTLKGHTGPITAVSFAANGLFVASGSEDKTVKVWGLTLGTLVATFTVSHLTFRKGTYKAIFHKGSSSCRLHGIRYDGFQQGNFVRQKRHTVYLAR